ncbi:claudin-2 [Latimeria chalumnae]|uniref:Claudin n=1 Tax=Latimeria chalumnae TaxID=7897 RepID=H3AZ73_LATCH|nr:PREDICTED: claudin-2 [Latimeria chalumnae]|eukprot:XP_006001377.1 PREDICTED: claudin-2 [Latimeria chalumnae]
MASVSIQLVGFILGLLGLTGALIATLLPYWHTTAYIGGNIITAVGYMKGLWMACAYQSTGITQCETYKSLLALPPDLQAARAFMVISCVLSLMACSISVVGMKCTVCIQGSSLKNKIAVLGGICFIIAGLLCIIPVAWTMNEIVRTFYNPVIPSSYKYEVGQALYLGIGSAIVSVSGGIMLCLTCSSQTQRPQYHGRKQPHPMTFQNPMVHSTYTKPPSGRTKQSRSNYSGYNLNGYI